MTVSVAEYFGQNTFASKEISPVRKEDGLSCPFMDKPCDKLIRKNKPVCSVRKNDGTLWIVCPHRLCASAKKTSGKNKKHLHLNPHQRDILMQIAKTIYRGDISPDKIAVNREVSIPIEGEGVSDYHADYVMRNLSEDNKRVDAIVLEMQGGGETSGTKSITDLVNDWENNPNRTNDMLRQMANANSIETNAWRRQQEQFLIKGNVANQSGGKLVFAIGTLLFDYLKKRFEQANLRDLRENEWTLCLLAFCEENSQSTTEGPVPLKVDENRLLFTNYASFVQFLTNQGGPNPQIFTGDFETLEGDLIKINDL